MAFIRRVKLKEKKKKRYEEADRRERNAAFPYYHIVKVVYMP